MSDIPISLNLEKCLGSSYSNFPRFAEFAYYDPLLKAFVTPECLAAAEKAKKALKRKQPKPPPKKKAKKSETPEETLTPDPPSFSPDDENEKRFLCEKAKSGISRCRKCGQAIEKDSLRFGYASPDPRGEYGAIPIWFHIRCAPLQFVGFDRFDETLASLCLGFSALPPQTQSEVFESAGKGIPRKPVNDEDAEYAGDFDESTDPSSLAEKLVHRRGVSVPLLDKPGELTGATLLPFQQEGFSWMVAQEQNAATRGGILADEMGMGKTLQTIALIIARRQEVRPTLVVAPVAAVMQWYSEIEKFTSNSNLLSVHVYHGSQKISAEKLAQFDIVLTTYQTLENDYRKESNKAKVMCKYCKKMFLPGKLSFHLKYMCGPQAMRTAAQSLRAVKDKATEKAKKTLGIGQGSSSSADPPTIANVLREIVKESGILGDEIDGLSQYQIMRMYRDGVKNQTIKEEEEVEKFLDQQDEEKRILSEAQLKKISVADLKEELRLNGVDGWNRMKKVEIIKLIVESGMAVRSSLASPKSTPAKKPTKPTSRESEESGDESEEESSADSDSSDSDSSRSKPSKKRVVVSSKSTPDTSLTYGRRSAAMKAIESFKDASSSGDERGSKRKHSDDSSDSSDSSESEISVDSESSSSDDDYTASESSGSTVEVDSSDSDMTDSEEESEEDDEPKRKGKRPVGRAGRGGQPRKLATAAPRVGRAIFNEEGEHANNNGDEEEDAVEDVDLNNSPLHCVKWGRLVLDEAHRIKQRTNSTSLAAFALAADFRWCLSGTPLQNRVGELYSLVRFLRFSPFAHYFCKGCDCKSLHFRFIDNKFCQKCGCARTKHYSYFKQVISGPIIKFGIGDGTALNILKTQVLDTVLLRRTKVERQSDLNLPPMTVDVRKTKLTPEEIDFYESIYKQSMLKFDTFAAQGTLLHNYAHIFDLLTRLRQAVDHPYLIVYGTDYTVPTSAAAATGAGSGNSSEGRGICSLCQDDIGRDENRAVANCGHKFHSDCVREYIRESPELPTGGTGCPACFVPLTLVFEDTEDGEGTNGQGAATGQTNTPEEELEERPETAAATVAAVRRTGAGILERVGAGAFKSSSKIEAVVEEMQQMAPDAKCLIFSQFTRMLDLVEFRLKQNGVGCAKLTGSQTLAQRSNIILAFNTDPSMKALLISLKAGGEGLNLQAANHVFLLDPWWNPASEMQAVQRAHRIGQTKPVKAIRFVTENTVEEKVIELQEMKQLVFEATVGQSQGAEKKLTESDLRFLFQH